MGTQCSSYCGGTCQKNDKIIELDPNEVKPF